MVFLKFAFREILQSSEMFQRHYFGTHTLAKTTNSFWQHMDKNCVNLFLMDIDLYPKQPIYLDLNTTLSSSISSYTNNFHNIITIDNIITITHNNKRILMLLTTTLDAFSNYCFKTLAHDVCFSLKFITLCLKKIEIKPKEDIQQLF